MGEDLDELIHLGAIGQLPIYILPKNWRGIIIDSSFFTAENGRYNKDPEFILLRDLTMLFPGTSVSRILCKRNFIIAEASGLQTG